MADKRNEDFEQTRREVLQHLAALQEAASKNSDINDALKSYIKRLERNVKLLGALSKGVGARKRIAVLATYVLDVLIAFGVYIRDSAIAIAALLGIVAAIVVLINGYQTIREKLQSIWGTGSSLFDILVSPALAQAASPATPHASSIVLPVIIFGGYLLFAVAYCFALYGLFISSDQKAPKGWT